MSETAPMQSWYRVAVYYRMNNNKTLTAKQTRRIHHKHNKAMNRTWCES